jgi:hypothetical protein
MKYLLCFFSLILLNLFVIGQKFQFSYYAGYGTYKMEDLKDFQKGASEIENFPSIMIIEDFPAYFNQSLQLELQVIKEVYIGINGGYQYTGARSHYADYSGEYKLDFQLNAYKIGANVKYVFTTKGTDNFDFYLNLRSGLTSSRMNLDESVVIYEVDSFQADRDYESKNLYIEPAAGLSYQLLRWITCGVYAGYEIDFPKALYQKYHEDITLKDQENNTVEIDWSGIRVYVSLGFCF